MASSTTKPAHSAIVNAMYDVELPLHNLRVMTEILGDMLDRYLVEYDRETGEKTSNPKKNGNLRIILSEGEHDCLSFAWNDVITKANQVEEAFMAALDGKELRP